MHSFPRSSSFEMIRTLAPQRARTVTAARRRRSGSPSIVGTPQRHRLGRSSSTRLSPAKTSPAKVSKGKNGRGGKGRSPLKERCSNSRGGANRDSWDFTETDMSRYQLSPAQQLRRHLLRISKHQDEAAKEVNHKLQRMQENITPFLQDFGATQSSPTLGIEQEKKSAATRATSSSGKRPNHMTPCFASRVPTGRLPAGESGNPTSSSPAAQSSKRGVLSGTQESAAVQVQGATVIQNDRHARFESSVSAYGGVPMSKDTLALALDAEIDDFMATKRSASQSALHKDSRVPQYRFLRRAQQADEATEPRRMGPPEVTVAPRNYNMRLNNGAANAESDSELGEIEDCARQLEAQLSWWRHQQQILTTQAGFNDSSDLATEASVGAAPISIDSELSGHSEWLRMSGARASATGVEKVNPLAMVDTSTSSQSPPFRFEPLARGEISVGAYDRARDTESSPSWQPLSFLTTGSTVDTAKGISHLLEGRCHTSLSEIVAQQAADLFGPTLGPDSPPVCPDVPTSAVGETSGSSGSTKPGSVRAVEHNAQAGALTPRRSQVDDVAAADLRRQASPWGAAQFLVSNGSPLDPARGIDAGTYQAGLAVRTGVVVSRPEPGTPPPLAWRVDEPSAWASQRFLGPRSAAADMTVNSSGARSASSGVGFTTPIAVTRSVLDSAAVVPSHVVTPVASIVETPDRAKTSPVAIAMQSPGHQQAKDSLSGIATRSPAHLLSLVSQHAPAESHASGNRRDDEGAEPLVGGSSSGQTNRFFDENHSSRPLPEVVWLAEDETSAAEATLALARNWAAELTRVGQR